ncbi:unnamed protein product [Dovyalis caffra]|uniref:Peptidase A1 domain-containing protein n=1 Tax=Dovyalis caffra TaxID=77055 RepID=A0AAV1RDW7_9ROSI|nr:unnamed protein product [Dovyalis caffra]
MALAFVVLHHSSWSLPSTHKNSEIVTKLIHRDSILSPYYKICALGRYINRDLTWISEWLRFILLGGAEFGLEIGGLFRENGRGEFCMAFRQSNLHGDTGSMFMVNLSIGEQLLTMDTGSNLLWVQCQPCIHCFEQYSPIFDGSKSSTYNNLMCNSPYSNDNSPKDKCDALNNCKFSHGYLDTTVAYGIMGNEKLTFFTSDEGIISSTIWFSVLGVKDLDIDPKVFQRDPEGKGGVLIDSSLASGRRYKPRSYSELRWLRFISAGGAEFGLEIGGLFRENGPVNFASGLSVNPISMD